MDYMQKKYGGAYMPACHSQQLIPRPQHRVQGSRNGMGAGDKLDAAQGCFGTQHLSQNLQQDHVVTYVLRRHPQSGPGANGPQAGMS